ncbi:hypothetical protein ACFL5J_01470 [Thermodesulfobacteriota bacterium]
METTVFEEMKKKWPSAVVARSEIGVFTGGALSPKTMANEDCKGTGIAGRITIGRQCVYPVNELIAWLKARAK